jgi:hypothetical protein
MRVHRSPHANAHTPHPIPARYSQFWLPDDGDEGTHVLSYFTMSCADAPAVDDDRYFFAGLQPIIAIWHGIQETSPVITRIVRSALLICFRLGPMETQPLSLLFFAVPLRLSQTFLFLPLSPFGLFYHFLAFLLPKLTLLFLYSQLLYSQLLVYTAFLKLLLLFLSLNRDAGLEVRTPDYQEHDQQ